MKFQQRAVPALIGFKQATGSFFLRLLEIIREFDAMLHACGKKILINIYENT